MTTVPVRIDQIHKNYGGHQVLESVGFSLEPGEIFGLIGLNGAGKTTLIKVMLDLITAQQGTVEIAGVSSRSIEARKNLSYLPEKFQPSRYLKGMEYLELALSYYGLPLDKDAARAKAAALDLDPQVLSRRVGGYSKGMGQKLGLVGAFLADRALLILDEPMSGLDPSARIRLKAELLANKRAGKTVFFSSHILSDIDEICDRIGIIHGGKLYFIGTPKAFKERMQESSLEKAFLGVIEAQPVAA
jgi:ABC-2 type transport system ATP-binding protein